MKVLQCHTLGPNLLVIKKSRLLFHIPEHAVEILIHDWIGTQHSTA